MGLMATIKARKAAILYSKGDAEGAMKLYEEAYRGGLQDARSLLSYSVLLIRSGKYAEARDLLIKTQKMPMPEENKRQLFCNYASCAYKMGDIDKGIELLTRLHQKKPSGLVYETLGYLLVESGDYERALAFNTEAYEYDDEDPITLDNLAQTYYRLGGDKVKAKEYFDKAHAIKDSQIDTLYFLARYDIEAGNKEAAKEKLEKALEGRFSPLNYATRDMVNELLSQLA